MLFYSFFMGQGEGILLNFCCVTHLYFLFSMQLLPKRGLKRRLLAGRQQ